MRLSKIWNRNYLIECKIIDLQTCSKPVWKASKALENHMKFEFLEWHWISIKIAKLSFSIECGSDHKWNRHEFCQKSWPINTRAKYSFTFFDVWNKKSPLFNAAYASDPRIQLLHANQIIVVEKRKVKIGLAVFLLLSLF